MKLIYVMSKSRDNCILWTERRQHPANHVSKTHPTSKFLNYDSFSKCSVSDKSCDGTTTRNNNRQKRASSFQRQRQTLTYILSP